MYRFAIVGCGVVLLSSTVTAFASEPKSATEKPVTEKSVLAKHGLTEFDRDGNGVLDASERLRQLPPGVPRALTGRSRPTPIRTTIRITAIRITAPSAILTWRRAAFTPGSPAGC